MDEEGKRSCYNCQHQSLCYLRRTIYNALLPECAWMLEGAPRPFMDIFDVLAEACNMYQRTETETEA